MNNFIPYGDKILIKQLPAKEVTKGGIIIPDTAKEKSLTAEVIAVGPKAVQTEVGDTVVFNEMAGKPVKFEDDNGVEQNLLIIWETEIALIKKRQNG